MLGKIVYFCPHALAPSGGVAVLLKQASLLKRAGFDVTVCYPLLHEYGNLFNPDWVDFPLSGLRFMPIGQGTVIHQGKPRRIDANLPLDAETLLVLPESASKLMKFAQGRVGECVVLAQSWMYLLKSLPNGVGWADYGIRRVLTVGESLRKFIVRSMPQLKVNVIRYAINRSVFKPCAPSQKRPLIVYQVRNEYMHQKLCAVERVFFLRNPRLAHYRFEWLRGLPREIFAERLATAAVALYTDEIAGMPTLPLEAMACGTVPVGWATFGGSEYMTEDNGFWVTSGDVLALAEKLGEVVSAIEEGCLDRDRLERGFEKTLEMFDELREAQETVAYFKALCSEPLPAEGA